jgi:hypothetical protein
MSDESVIRAKTVVALAAILGQVEDATRQRSIGEFQLFPEMVDMLEDADAEAAAILIRAVASSIHYLVRVGEKETIAETLAEIDAETLCADIDHELPQDALPELELISRTAGEVCAE